MKLMKFFWALALLLIAGFAVAQTDSLPPPDNVFAIIDTVRELLSNKDPVTDFVQFNMWVWVFQGILAYLGTYLSAKFGWWETISSGRRYVSMVLATIAILAFGRWGIGWGDFFGMVLSSGIISWMYNVLKRKEIIKSTSTVLMETKAKKAA